MIVQVRCKTCGNIRETTSDNILRFGCKNCSSKEAGNKRKKSLEEFITEANEVHHNYYDYSEVNYITTNVKVCIICPEHGQF